MRLNLSSCLLLLCQLNIGGVDDNKLVQSAARDGLIQTYLNCKTLLNHIPPVPFIDMEKAMSRSVNLMLSVRHGSKIRKTFSTTRSDELLSDPQSNLPSLVNWQNLLWEDIFDQLSDLGLVDLPAGKIPFEGAPELNNLILGKPCVLKILALTCKLVWTFHLLEPVVLPVAKLVRLVLAGDDHLHAGLPLHLHLLRDRVASARSSSFLFSLLRHFR